MRELLWKLSPPIVTDFIRKRAPGLRNLNCFGRYRSREEARAAAGGGYTDRRIPPAVFAKTAALREQLRRPPLVETSAIDRVATMLGLVATLALSVPGTGARRLHVLDFGGAAGHHFHIAKALVPTRKFEWNVVETEAMCEAAEPFQNEELRFYPATLPWELWGIEVVHSDATLQMLDDPISAIRRLASLGAPFLSIRRIALNEGPAFSSVLKTRLSRLSPEEIPLPEGMADAPLGFPVTFADRLEFENALAEKYRIRLRFFDQQAVYRGKDFELDMIGYFCELR